MTRRIKAIIAIIATCPLLAACGIAAKIDARNDMFQSKALYRNCLIKHSNNPSACDGLKLAYDADMKAYRAASAGIRQGYSNSLDVSATGE